jgi:tetratricopeptide (TPR) repeat protein
LEVDAHHAPAQINLGTIFYNRGDFAQAETYYRQAIESDPRYALAYFDLGNVLDETGRLTEAIKCYQTAIMLAPTYADAHYNVALAFEKLKNPRKALSHWQAYLKLDSSGPWYNHAFQQTKKILREERLKIVHRRTN